MPVCCLEDVVVRHSYYLIIQILGYLNDSIFQSRVNPIWKIRVKLCSPSLEPSIIAKMSQLYINNHVHMNLHPTIDSAKKTILLIAAVLDRWNTKILHANQSYNSLNKTKTHN